MKLWRKKKRSRVAPDCFGQFKDMENCYSLGCDENMQKMCRLEKLEL